MWMTDIFVGRRIGERIGREGGREGGRECVGVSICVHERERKRKMNSREQGGGSSVEV